VRKSDSGPKINYRPIYGKEAEDKYKLCWSISVMRCDHCVIALFILGDFYYYFIQQLCAYCVNFSDRLLERLTLVTLMVN